MSEYIPLWRGSSASGGGNCAEVASMPGGVAVRDSKHPTAPHLNLTVSVFGAVLNHLKDA